MDKSDRRREKRRPLNEQLRMLDEEEQREIRVASTSSFPTLSTPVSSYPPTSSWAPSTSTYSQSHTHAQSRYPPAQSGWGEDPYQSYSATHVPQRNAVSPLFPQSSAAASSSSSARDYYPTSGHNQHHHNQHPNSRYESRLPSESISPQLLSQSRPPAQPQASAEPEVAKTIPLPSREQVHDYLISHMSQPHGLNTGWRLENYQFDVYVLFGAIVRAGGSTRVSSRNWWPLIAGLLGLPAHDTPDGLRASEGVGRQLQTFFLKMLGGLEILWERTKPGDEVSLDPRPPISLSPAIPTPVTAHHHNKNQSNSASGVGGSSSGAKGRFAQLDQQSSPHVTPAPVSNGPSWATAATATRSSPAASYGVTSNSTRPQNSAHNAPSTSNEMPIINSAPAPPSARPSSSVSEVPLHHPSPSHPSSRNVGERLSVQAENTTTSRRPAPSTDRQPSATASTTTKPQKAPAAPVPPPAAVATSSGPLVQLQFHGRNIGEYRVPTVASFRELVQSNFLPLPQVKESITGVIDGDAFTTYAKRCHELGNSVKKLVAGEPQRVVSADEVVFWTKLLAIMKQNPTVIPPPVDDRRPQSATSTNGKGTKRASTAGQSSSAAHHETSNGGSSTNAKSAGAEDTPPSKPKRGRPRKSVQSDYSALDNLPPLNTRPDGAPGSLSNPTEIVPTTVQRPQAVPTTQPSASSAATGRPAGSYAGTGLLHASSTHAESPFASANPASTAGPSEISVSAKPNGTVIQSDPSLPDKKKRGRPKGSKTKPRPVVLPADSAPDLSNSSVPANSIPTPAPTSSIADGATQFGPVQSANEATDGLTASAGPSHVTNKPARKPKKKERPANINGDVASEALPAPSLATPSNDNRATSVNAVTPIAPLNAIVARTGVPHSASTGPDSAPDSGPSRHSLAGRARWVKWKEEHGNVPMNRRKDLTGSDGQDLPGTASASGSPVIVNEADAFSDSLTRRRGGFGIPAAGSAAAKKRRASQKDSTGRAISASPSIARTRIPFTPDLSPKKRIDLSGSGQRSVAQLRTFDTPIRFVPKHMGSQQISSLSQPSPLSLSQVTTPPAASASQPSTSANAAPSDVDVLMDDSFAEMGDMNLPDHDYSELAQAILDSAREQQAEAGPFTLNATRTIPDVSASEGMTSDSQLVTPSKRRSMPIIEIPSAKRTRPTSDVKPKTVRLPVDRAKVVLSISRRKRDDLIRQGHYDAFQDDDSGDEALRCRTAASHSLRPVKITLPSARSVRPKEPEEIPLRFLSRPGPGLLEPYASVLTEKSLINRCIEHPCGWKGCDAVLASEALLKKHIERRDHVEQGKFQASVARWVFKRGATTVTEDVPGSWLYRCHWRGCEEPCYHTGGQLAQHVAARHVSRVLYCPYEDCDLTSPTISHLSRHVMKTHDLPTDLPVALADFSIPVPPTSYTSTVDLPPLPEFARTDELTTPLVSGSSYRTTHKQEWLKAKVLSHCFAGDDPIIHIEHPPHMLEKVEEGTEEVELENDVLARNVGAGAVEGRLQTEARKEKGKVVGKDKGKGKGKERATEAKYRREAVVELPKGKRVKRIRVGLTEAGPTGITQGGHEDQEPPQPQQEPGLIPDQDVVVQIADEADQPAEHSTTDNRPSLAELIQRLQPPVLPELVDPNGRSSEIELADDQPEPIESGPSAFCPSTQPPIIPSGRAEGEQEEDDIEQYEPSALDQIVDNDEIIGIEDEDEQHDEEEQIPAIQQAYDGPDGSGLEEQDEEEEERPSREVSLELPIDFSAPTPWPARLDSPESDADTGPLFDLAMPNHAVTVNEVEQTTAGGSDSYLGSTRVDDGAGGATPPLTGYGYEIAPSAEPELRFGFASTFVLPPVVSVGDRSEMLGDEVQLD